MNDYLMNDYISREATLKAFKLIAKNPNIDSDIPYSDIKCVRW